MPTAGPDQVLVRTRYSLVSAGTERHYIAQCRAHDTRLRLGYCIAGHVHAPSAALPALAPGAPVIGMGWGYACHAEYVVMPWRLVQPVPAACPLSCAVFANLLATAVHSADRAALRPQDRILVIGAGLLGRLVAETALSVCGDVTLTDQLPERCKVPARFTTVPSAAMLEAPAGWSGRFTKAFICIHGDATDWMSALPLMMAPRGNGTERARIIAVGRYVANMTFSVELGNLDIVIAARCGEGYRDDRYVHGAIDLTPLPGEHTVDANMARALALISEQRVDVSDLLGAPIALAALPDFYNSIGAGTSAPSTLVHYE